METVSMFSSDLPLASNIIGSKQVYSILVLPNIKLLEVSILLYYFRVGNYYHIVINFLIKLFLGEEFISTYKPEMKRLITK